MSQSDHPLLTRMSPEGAVSANLTVNFSVATMSCLRVICDTWVIYMTLFNEYASHLHGIEK